MKKEKFIFHKATSVSPLKNLELSVHFQDGLTKIYDMKPLLDEYPMFRELKKNKKLFESATVDVGGYGIIWNDDIDISCDEIWVNGRTVKTPFDAVLSFSDASTIWGLNESTLRKAVKYGKFVKGIDVCKFGKQWLISREAMEREYGLASA